MDHTLRPIVNFTTEPSGAREYIFKTFYLNNSYIIFTRILITNCTNSIVLKKMYLLNNSRNLSLSSSTQYRIVSGIKEFSKLVWDVMQNKIQIVPETSVNNFLTASINYIF